MPSRKPLHAQDCYPSNPKSFINIQCPLSSHQLNQSGFIVPEQKPITQEQLQRAEYNRRLAIMKRQKITAAKELNPSSRFKMNGYPVIHHV